MKRKIFTGIIVILVLLLASCDFTQDKATEEVEYTDVVYSFDKDGTTNITLYLDGVGVPKTAEQRALFRDLAVMTHDYFEVIFVDSAVIARAAWELGANAGISGVSRDDTGKNYAAISGTTAACIFVGRKSDMTLLGVGHMIQVDRLTHPTNLLKTTSKSVTFQVVALNTKLTATPSTYAGTVDPQPGKIDDGSFWLGNPYAAGATSPSEDASSATKTDARAQWTSLEGVAYPMFNLDKFDTAALATAKNTTVGLYKFFGPFDVVAANVAEGRPVASIDMSAAVMCDRGTSAAPLTPEVIKRDPRFLAGGQTWYVQTARKDTKTTVAFYPPHLANQAAIDTAIDAQFGTITTPKTFPHAGIKFYFTVGSASDNGVFSFVFQVPVYMMVKTPPTNGGPEYKTWYIRPGFSTDQYNLDNGVDAGGGVLMGVGVKGLDWLQIFVTGLGFTL